MATALVTGANGFVGAALCNSLRAHGWAVRTPTLRLLESADKWQEALSSVDYVVHLAARVHQMSNDPDDHEYWRINVEGSRSLAKQAAQANVRRFVFLSSVKVNGEGSTHPYAAIDVPAPQDPYGRSKRDAEFAIREVCAHSRMECVVIRPPLVYGPGVKANFRRLLNWVDRGIPLPLASIENRRSLVGLSNLVNFIEVCLTHEKASEQVWFVADEGAVSTPQLLQKIALHMRRPSRLLPFPPVLLHRLATLAGLRAEADRLCGSLQIDSHAATTALQWIPKVSLDEELARTIAAYRAEGSR